MEKKIKELIKIGIKESRKYKIVLNRILPENYLKKKIMELE